MNTWHIIITREIIRGKGMSYSFLAHRLRVAPALLGRLTRHRQANRLGTLLGWPRVGVSRTPTAPSSLHSVHAGSLLLAQSKDATGWRWQLARLFPWT